MYIYRANDAMFSNNVFNRCEWLSTQWHKKGTKDYDLNWSTTWSEARLEITIDVRFNSFKGFFRKRIIERKLFEMRIESRSTGLIKIQVLNFSSNMTFWNSISVQKYCHVVFYRMNKISFAEYHWKKPTYSTALKDLEFYTDETIYRYFSDN